MEKQEDWIIEYFEIAIAEIDKTHDWLIKNDHYIECNTNLSMAKESMKMMIKRLKKD
jgi:hypothetical protein